MHYDGGVGAVGAVGELRGGASDRAVAQVEHVVVAVAVGASSACADGVC